MQGELWKWNKNTNTLEDNNCQNAGAQTRTNLVSYMLNRKSKDKKLRKNYQSDHKKT